MQLNIQSFHKRNESHTLFHIKITDMDLSDGIVHHIHYVGYSHRRDKWRKNDEIEDLSLVSGSTKRKSNANPTETRLLSLELVRKIKSSLNGSRKDDPNVCIEILCSQEWFNISLKSRGVLKKRERR